MHLFALILGILLLPKGDTLKCHECIPDNLGKCTETQRECLSQSHQCGASRVIAYAGGSKILDQNGKSCALPEECGEASVNFGLSKTWINTQCCNSNLCNTQSVPDSSKTTPNGRQCFTCDGFTCDKTLGCEGNEDHCVTATGGITTTVKGCISELMCSSSNSFPSQLLETKISCCKGNFCNSAVTASAGLQLVVVALISLTLFS
uniref:UPAR/Ly6 domain-containing protein n=1 Tax=Oryzias latipes TaxID=8090 RepID=A0A3P9ITB9_ORYLA